MSSCQQELIINTREMNQRSLFSLSPRHTPYTLLVETELMWKTYIWILNSNILLAEPKDIWRSWRCDNAFTTYCNFYTVSNAFILLVNQVLFAHALLQLTKANKSLWRWSAKIPSLGLTGLVS